MPLKVSDVAPGAAGQPDQSAPSAPVAALSDAQFARLEELLMPGYLLSKFYLDDMKAQNEQRLADEHDADVKKAPEEAAAKKPA